MILRLLKRGIRGESGVAMVTVLFVGAALTAVASVAAFTSVRELQATGDDRRASEALAVAEAGIDRFIEVVKSGQVHWGELRLAGCDADHPPVQLSGQLDAARSFNVSFTAYNPFGTTTAQREAPAACVASENNSRHPSPKTRQFFAITSTGQAPAATRVVRQVVLISTVGLPIGVYAEGVNMNGTPDFNGVSFLSRFDVEGREKMGFSGVDPYYTLADFWPGQSSTIHVPASVHTMGNIYLKAANQENSVEHPPSLNCTANKPGSQAAQSQWDQSSAGGTLSGPCQNPAWQPYVSTTGEEIPTQPAAGSYPPSSEMTAAAFDEAVPAPSLSDQDYLALRLNARQQGLYCFIPTVGAKECRRAGTSWTGQDGTLGNTITVGTGDVTEVVNAGATSFVAYFEYEDPSQAAGLNNVVFAQGADVWPCSDNLALHRSVVLIVRNGSYGLGTGDVRLNGLMVVPEGEVRLRGGHHFHGTILAKRINLVGGATFSNSPCWVRNMPGPFLSLAPTRWSEVDRP